MGSFWLPFLIIRNKIGDMRKILSYISLVVVGGILLASSAQAVCPICTIAVVGGVGLSRWLGIDDSITGLWVGGLIVSFIMWTIKWFEKKNIRFKGRDSVTILAFYALTIVPLYFTDILGHPLNKLWGIDKLILGIIVGSVFFTLGDKFCCYLKSKNEGKAHFPFQKVVLPIIPLLILSFIFYLITK
jgi:hypothetical protein